MTTPAVSVVIPCFNGGRFLDNLLAGLAAQTFRDFEIVIVDDGSTEQGTRDKLAELERSVRVIRQENRGLPGARNTGFREARGEFVLPLDCDDNTEPTLLAETVAALRNAPESIGFVFTHMRLTGVTEGVLPRHFNQFDQLFHNRLPYCMLIRKSAWMAVGGYDEAMRDGYEDWEFNIRLTTAGFRGLEIAKPLFVYRVASEGMLLSKSARMHATLWRQIREKYPDLYSLRGLRKAFRESYPGGGIGTLILVAPVFGLTRTLPDAIVNQLLFYFLRVKRHLRRVLALPRTATRDVQDYSAGASPLPSTIDPASPAANTTRDYTVTRPTGTERFISRLRLLMSVVLVATAFYFVSTDAFLTAVRRINVLLVGLSIILFIVQVLVVSWRFQMTLRLCGVRVGFIPALEATSLSVVAGAVLLSPIVGLVLRILVLRNADCPVRTLVLASLVERGVLLVVLVAAALVSAWWLRLDLSWTGSWVHVGWAFVLLGILAAIGWVVVYRLRYIAQIRQEWTRTLIEVRSFATNISGMLVVTLVTIASHVVFLAAAIAAAHATHIELGLLDLSAAVSATMLLASIPVAISGWGVREISLIWLLGHLGVGGSVALAFSIVIGILSLLAAALASAMSLVIGIIERRHEAAI